MIPPMLLRNSVSITKKFFQKTIQSFKSFFSDDHYQKLPKNPPNNNPFSSSIVGNDMINAQTNVINNKDLDSFCNDFIGRWDGTNKKNSQRNGKKTSPSSSSTKQERDHDSSFIQFSGATALNNYQIEGKDQSYSYYHRNDKFCGAYVRRRSELEDDFSSRETASERRSFLVSQTLKELEMMDVTNMEHVLDIEEVLHYYSRLTCPAYLDIVEKFFMDIYAEFVGPPVTPPCSFNSRLRLRSVRS